MFKKGGHLIVQVIRKRLVIKGIVQGVGFRPLVFTQAMKHRIGGFVMNTGSCLHIEAEGAQPEVEVFLNEIASQPPKNAEISSIGSVEVEPDGRKTFTILPSEDGERSGLALAPDTAACVECIEEIFNPTNRRYQYPFNSCIHCGPRFSIAESQPFDRGATSMKKFSMCDACQREYEDSSSRRFHSQTNSCAKCGPGIWLTDTKGKRIEAADPLQSTIALLKEGKIIAIKGVGGFHLAVNAQDEEAVRRLRERKRRPTKPFAIMAPAVQEVLSYAEISETESAALTSAVAPIVILQKKKSSHIAEEVAPGLHTLGVMLAYAPLHHLLLRHHFSAMVMTSANFNGEPLIHRNDEAISRLAGIADFLLLNDRDIVRRCDDSMIRFSGTQPILLRRSRGLIPRPIILAKETKPVLGFGGQQKNTICITKANHAHVSRYIGDLDHLRTVEYAEDTLDELQQLLAVKTEATACDLHPDYESSRLAKERTGARTHQIQHHHAHALSCMAENRLTDKEALAVVFDGAGLGDDGAMWGSEFLKASAATYLRLAHLKYVRMPGGQLAVREPYRMALSYLYESYRERTLEVARDLFSELRPERLLSVLRVLKSGEYAPFTCGMGRLFDAVAAILGLCPFATFEGEGPAYLESLADKKITDAYEFQIESRDTLLIDPAPVLREVMADLHSGAGKEMISSRFHNAVSDMVVKVCGEIRTRHQLDSVVLSGGVFQNAYLFQRVVQGLKAAEFNVAVHRLLPPNDECISLGQAIIASEREG